MEHSAQNYLKRLATRLRQIHDQPYELFHLEDLAHSLRLIVDAEKELKQFLQGKKFDCWKPSTDERKRLKRCRHLMTFFGRNIAIPNAPANNLKVGVGLPIRFFPDIDGFGMMQTMGMRRGYLEVDRLFVVLSDNEISIPDPYRSVERKEFPEWLTSHLLTVQYVTKDRQPKRVVFGRNKYIKRLSSSFGGSHPRGSARKSDENEVIEWLLDRKLAGFPVAYIIAYSVAVSFMYQSAPSMVDFLPQPREFPPEE